MKIKQRTVMAVWGISLSVMGFSGLIISVSRIADIALPDTVQKVIGITATAALAVFGFASVLRVKTRR